jgi:hypothetical protein
MPADRITEAAIDELGPIVLRCRNRRRSSSWLAVGGSPFTPYLTPPMAAMFLTFPLVGIAVWQGVPPPVLKNPVWGPILVVWFGACCIGLYWYNFTAPAADVLVLHERGFRYRRRIIPFDRLAAIRPGIDEPRIVELLNRFTGNAGKRNIHISSAHRLAERARRASVTLEFKEGRPLRLRSILVQHDADDLQHLFSTIASRYPEVIPHQELATIQGLLTGQSF